ncbi:MAG: pilus assembly protein PilM [Candidatus Poribacteria bacterium]|nr:pilus assembly protein PilM [Candidatus Poribacteria bacterium]
MAKKQVVAVDIGTHTAKMVQLEQSSAGTRLINADIVTYADTGDQQQVAESIENLWASLGKPPKQRNLSSLFNRNKTEVVLALPRALVSTKRLANLPAATDDQLANIVEIAAEAELPFRVEEAIFTYHDVRRTSEATSVELISTRRASVTNYMDLLEQIGISASGVTPSMIAIAETATSSGCTKPTFIVDIGAAQTDFCFVEDGVLRFSRSFRLGGDNLSEHVSRALDVDSEAAAEEKRHISADEAPTAPWTAELVSELQRSIAAATIHRESDNFDTVEETGISHEATRSKVETELWLCGGGARVPNLAATLEAELDLPTYLWNPLQAIEQQAAIKIEPGRAEAKAILDEWGDTLAVPLGVGLTALNPTTQVSLLPKEAAETLTQTTRQHQILAATGLGVLIVGGIFFGGYTLQRSQKHRAEMVEAQLAGYVQPLAAAKAQLGRELALTEMLAHNISPLDILHALSEMFRDRTQVAWTNFNITNLHTPQTARITFNLEGASHDAINSLLGALDRSGVFTNVRPGEVTTISQNRKEIFQVQVRCNLTDSAVRAFAQKRYPMPDPQIDEPEKEAEFYVPPPASKNLENEENEKIEKEE